jgi:hypothetical protein
MNSIDILKLVTRKDNSIYKVSVQIYLGVGKGFVIGLTTLDTIRGMYCKGNSVTFINLPVANKQTID